MRNFRSPGPLHVDGESIVDAEGNRVVLRGVGLGGWMNMENFITGYPATESQMRASVTAVLGPGRAARFFDRLLTRFFERRRTPRCSPGSASTAYGSRSTTATSSATKRPFELREEGFERLDRVVAPAAPSTASTA